MSVVDNAVNVSPTQECNELVITTSTEDIPLVIHKLLKGHFTVIEPSKFQNETMKSSNINALFCHTNTKMPENYNFLILVHCYPIIN